MAMIRTLPKVLCPLNHRVRTFPRGFSTVGGWVVSGDETCSDTCSPFNDSGIAHVSVRARAARPLPISTGTATEPGRCQARWDHDQGTSAGAAGTRLVEYRRARAQDHRPARQDRTAGLLDVLLHQLSARAG